MRKQMIISNKFIVNNTNDIDFKKIYCITCVNHEEYQCNRINTLQSLLNSNIINSILIDNQLSTDESKIQSTIHAIKDLIELIPSKLWVKHIKTIDDISTKYYNQTRPVSRSYFKMCDIIDSFHHIFHEYKNKGSRRFHLCEAPGGFIQACNDFFENSNYITVSLRSTSGDIPHFRCTPNTSDFCIDRSKIIGILDSDVTKYTVMSHIIKHIRIEGSVDIITADGGITVKMYSEQEQQCMQLIASQIYIALHVINIGGTFILKVFETFTSQSKNLISILANMFDNIMIFKPRSSRTTNSEKYIVCVGYNPHLYHTEFYTYTKYCLCVATYGCLHTAPLKTGINYSSTINNINNMFVCIQGHAIIRCVDLILENQTV